MIGWLPLWWSERDQLPALRAQRVGADVAPAWQLAAALGVVLLCFVSSGCDRWFGPACDGMEQPSAAKPLPFAPEVDTVLRQKLDVLQSLAADPAVVQAAQEGSRKNGQLSADAICELDEQWRNAPVDSHLVQPLLTNACARSLLAFQEEHDGFPEIFVTDREGLVVGATNKTSDYYQADEDWWKQTFAGGRGQAHYGEIEYDDSAESESVSLCVPIRDPQTRRVIGVLKAVYDIEAIVEEL
ncbi:MAG: hypothetical protein GXP27_03565 [Planctomycetes bacterium]|nr:hypothetical protein [Planctomycetota bacterium]